MSTTSSGLTTASSNSPHPVDGPETLSPSAALAALREKRWIDDRTLVEEGVAVVDLSRSHSVLSVEVAGKARWILKKYREPRGDFDGTLARERSAHELARRLPELAALMPAMQGSLGETALVFEAFAGHQAWTESGVVRPDVLRALAHMHVASTAVVNVHASPLPWTLTVMDFDGPSLFWSSEAATLLSQLGRSPAAMAAIREARHSWQPSSFIHGDAKLDNVLLADDDTGGFVFVDWELSGCGDPLWDLAGLLFGPLYQAALHRTKLGADPHLMESVSYGLGGYFDTAPAASDAARFLSFCALWMLQSACTGLQSQHLPREHAQSVATACEELLSGREEMAAALVRRAEARG